jgi:hypothetical protein
MMAVPEFVVKAQHLDIRPKSIKVPFALEVLPLSQVDFPAWSSYLEYAF